VTMSHDAEKEKKITYMDAMPTHKKSWNITPIYATHQVTQQVEKRKG